MKHYFSVAALGLMTVLQAQTALADPYVRADLGFAMPLKFKPKISDSSYKPEGLYNKKANNSAIYSAGFGYAFNEMVRGDVTLTRVAGFSYNGQSKGSDIGSKFGSEIFSVKNKVSNVVTMGNVYVDITEMGQFTPFVTLGVGMSRNKADDLMMHNSTINSNTYAKGQTNNTLAWGVGFGTGYKIENVYIDVMYRFMHLGSFKAGAKWGSDTSPAATVTGLQSDARVQAAMKDSTEFKSKLAMHSLALGVRIMF